MQKLFNKILIPVDFSPVSKRLLEKAVEMALQYNCTIHLLHVMPNYVAAYCALVRGGMMLPLDAIDDNPAIEKAMEKMCGHIPEKLKDASNPWYTIQAGNWDDAIINLVQADYFDLVLIDRESLLLSAKRIALDPDKIAQKTGVPVISLPAESRLGKLGSIVIPVTNFLPLRKLIYGIYMAQASNIVLKLVGIENKTNAKVGYYLAKCFSLVRDNCSLQVELEMTESNNVAEGIKSFAGSHATDLIIVNPGTQTKMQSFFARLTRGSLQKYSIPPVLTVSPA
ncbi:MAG: universal stress protein [Ferruginibacter sp.]|nr:universal stress protein [Ferruginibacter sp.]